MDSREGVVLSKRYRWYEKLFFRLELNKRKCGQLLAGLLIIIILGQILLTNSTVRKYLVLTETYDGKPAKFYHNYK